ncbi:Cytosolic endo-beta-N-acetylglucosaminidase 2 [Grifola frondosa]|uniref:Cytosolic endo-beta-N-acetylglucosaminidase 2 n=1 Tax=Grifola frondosa TaxID=5627 RepID=A0A1C7LNF5_GRIFR|nr:Cytosolic endo-beta-N-acetylglucosaminidase 2 [Grifola frondosa]
MPLNGTNHTVNVFDDSPYFKSLSDLDAWAKSPSNKLKGVMPYHSREVVEGVQAHNRGKLLVCHDYKGGYTESPSALSYTFNFWPYCDTFIYFSHHRITVPPSGWTNAAHRNGVRMLGTLIFESSGEEDCLRLLVGALPKCKTGPAIPHGDTSLPLSPHYAYLLAELAYQRGFDGYLLNFECPLRGRLEQTRILAAWISLLEIELKRRVGSHAEAIWYDSVVLTGDLRWQDRLNHYNLPFFIPSSGFFTNYTWPPHYPSLTAQYFISLDPTHLSRPKSLHNIFVGIDVWGRGSHGGGGFGCYKAISHIDPQFLGLSVALFGQAWTWESEQDKPGWTWDAWWTYERKLWLGPTNESEPITLPPPREGEPECPHGPFLPISSFFVRQPPPNPAALPFFTSFSPGVGRLWFVRGIKVMQTDDGWTDVDKNCSLGDLAWPRVALQWEHGEHEDALPELSSELCMTDAWLGGSSLQLTSSTPGSDAEDAFFRVSGCLFKH